MITEGEEIQLARLEAEETDFYCAVVFLVETRMEHYRASIRERGANPDVKDIADITLEIFRDLNERVARSNG